MQREHWTPSIWLWKKVEWRQYKKPCKPCYLLSTGPRCIWITPCSMLRRLTAWTTPAKDERGLTPTFTLSPNDIAIFGIPLNYQQPRQTMQGTIYDTDKKAHFRRRRITYGLPPLYLHLRRTLKGTIIRIEMGTNSEEPQAQDATPFQILRAQQILE